MVFVLELTPFDGEFASVSVTSDSFTSNGEPRVFCVVKMDDDGVLQVVDSGYTSLREVRDAWPQAERGPRG